MATFPGRFRTRTIDRLAEVAGKPIGVHNDQLVIDRLAREDREWLLELTATGTAAELLSAPPRRGSEPDPDRAGAFFLDAKGKCLAWRGHGQRSTSKGWKLTLGFQSEPKGLELRWSEAAFNGPAISRDRLCLFWPCR